MTYVITQHCCGDATCTDVCPVDCIHPTPDEPGYTTAEMLYIDPNSCVDCGACLDVCPVSAIAPDYDLTGPELPFVALNAIYYESVERTSPSPDPFQRRGPALVPGPHPRLDVAIIGSGPSGWYAAEELLSIKDAQVSVTMFERLPVPFGLARFGVAPDHPMTKKVVDTFAQTAKNGDFTLRLNVEVGRDVDHSDLERAFHAVIYAVGSMEEKPLGIPGEHLVGSHSATEFVAWYNGHPDFSDRTFDFSTGTAVIIGNGNVALDVARILASDVGSLAQTDIAQHALDQLAESKVEEVVVLGRRGPREAAFTHSELLGLLDHPDFSLEVDPSDFESLPVPRPDTGSSTGDLKLKQLAGLRSGGRRKSRRIILRFALSPLEMRGQNAVDRILVGRNQLLARPRDAAIVARATSQTHELACGLVFRSVGYRGTEISEVPFDTERGIYPNQGGRLMTLGGAQPLYGVYATGWIKRGPSGMLGTNRLCARETVATLLKDHAGGMLSSAGTLAITEILGNLPHSTGIESWYEIDRLEREAGAANARPRIKMVDIDALLNVVTD